MKQLIFCSLAILVFCTVPAFAAIPKRLLITGKVTQISKDTVTLNTDHGEVKVSRKDLLGQELVKGRNVSVSTTWKRLYELN